MTDLFRPIYHFTPKNRWMNDPNGMVYYRGEYHLFYQHHPESDVWGPMHWGHAVSMDLTHWRHLPIALAPDENGMIFSGSAVIDWMNSAGFGNEAMVAIFTHHNDGIQSQSIAFSLDNGRTFTKYAGNPVIPSPGKGFDFRDPKVIRHQDHWVMLLAAKDSILFFTSKNLREWQPSGKFGGGNWGCTEGVWETPDLFELPIEDSNQTAWVLTVGVGDGFSLGSGTQYFLGNFDGEKFTCEDPPRKVRWMDHGADFYAPQSFSDASDGRRIMIAWMSNWRYAIHTPTVGWRSEMSIPRQILLRKVGGQLVLIQRPIREIDILPRKTLFKVDHQLITENTTAESHFVFRSGQIKMRVAVDGIKYPFGWDLFVSGDNCVKVRVDPVQMAVSIDRSVSSNLDFHPFFSAIHQAAFVSKDGLLDLEIYIDRSSIEVFCQGGETCITDLIFPGLDIEHRLVLPTSGLLVDHLQVTQLG